MHILVVNDDGPRSPCSPYIYPFVKALQAAGHRTSVVLPNISRSWIGKALIVGATIECSFSAPAPGEQEWVLINGTPASCTQLGLYHLFQDLPPVDLVVSGPNFGRNATTIYNLSSGTVGGALEAALCKKKAIALSFASKDAHSPNTIEATVRISVKLIERLYRSWGSGVELYNINVPMQASIKDRQILYTKALYSRWSSGSLYQELLGNGSHSNIANAGHTEVTTNGYTETTTNGDTKLIKNGHSHENSSNLEKLGQHQDSLLEPAVPKTRFFKWAPQLLDITRCVDESPPGTDAWAVSNGFISVTPLTASFAQVQGISGSFKLW